MPGKQIDEIFKDKIQLIVHTARRCASVAGRVVEAKPPIQKSDTRMQRRKFYRVKVELDLKKPIAPGCFLGKRGNNSPQIVFRYEKLPNICFRCGLFDHETSRCANKERDSRIKYENIIRAEFIPDDDCSVSEKFTTLEKADGGATKTILRNRLETVRTDERKGYGKSPVGIPNQFEGINYNTDLKRVLKDREDRILYQEGDNLEKEAIFSKCKSQTGKEICLKELGFEPEKQPSDGPDFSPVSLSPISSIDLKFSLAH